MALAAGSFKVLQCPTATPLSRQKDRECHRHTSVAGKARKRPWCLGPGCWEVAIQPPAPQAFPGPGPSCVTLPCCCPEQGLRLLPSSWSHQVCEPPAGRDPAVARRWPWRCARCARAGSGQPSVGWGELFVPPPLSRRHEASSSEEASEFWYGCCSWCCESGRRAAHPLTRLFHDTRVASYPSSPGSRVGPGLGLGTGCGEESV